MMMAERTNDMQAGKSAVRSMAQVDVRELKSRVKSRKMSVSKQTVEKEVLNGREHPESQPPNNESKTWLKKTASEAAQKFEKKYVRESMGQKVRCSEVKNKENKEEEEG